ncbi:MAG TPA: RelA/SpoT family protein [Candidatus Paceibacterota bacterium]|nr:RelA/SpoT family protein [Candidatus Paceibacterota bacterium]
MPNVKELILKAPDGAVARAFAFSENAHRHQKRRSGDPYFNHVLATANILSEWHLDEATVAAGLLHDTVEDTGVPLETIKKEFGEEVAFLVDGVTKLGRIKYRGAESKVENLRKMILALSEDLRVVFIKLADRLHNMRTLGALPPVKQKRIAMETDEIYAPLAYRLGMQNLSGELQDLAFPFLHPQEYRWLLAATKEQYEARLHYLESVVKPEIQSLLAAHAIRPITIDFRAKRYASLYKKLLQHDMNVGKIYDLVAMRVIVQSIPECYAVLGIIHEKWPPMPGRIKDYIAMPKPNSYRSLHTTVIGPEQKIMEFQIRTKDMHEENEYGIAAHWLYEQKKKGETMSAKKMTEEIRWVQQLRNWMERYRGDASPDAIHDNPEEFLQSMKIDFFKDRIFAITPHGDAIDLPAGSTPVDFAYHVHSEIGNTCVGARVNHELVPLDRELRSGDLVEIVTQKGKKPSEDWLQFVKSALARDHIKYALRAKNKLGREAAKPVKAEMKIATEDRVGLLKNISTVIANLHVNVLAFEIKNQPSNRFPVHRVEIGTTDKQKIERLILKIKKIKGVKEVSYKLV